MLFYHLLNGFIVVCVPPPHFVLVFIIIKNQSIFARLEFVNYTILTMYRKFIWQTVLFVVVVVVEAILQSHHFTNSVTNCNLCEHKVKKKCYKIRQKDVFFRRSNTLHSQFKAKHKNWLERGNKLEKQVLTQICLLHTYNLWYVIAFAYARTHWITKRKRSFNKFSWIIIYRVSFLIRVICTCKRDRYK